MAPPPLHLFSPSPRPPPPWLHGPQVPSTPVAPRDPAEAPPKQPRGPKPVPRNPGSSSDAAKPLTAGVPGDHTRRAVLGIIREVRSLELSDPRRPSPNGGSSGTATARVPFHLPIEPPPEREEEEEKVRPRAVPWATARDEALKVVLRREKVRVPTRAETELETAELERLRRAARGKDRWVRAKKAGITDEVVEEVRGKWARGQEHAGVRIVEPLRLSMDRAREILEIKTGGLVVQTRGDIHFAYRGSNYIENSKQHHHFVNYNEEVSPVTPNIPTSQGKYGSKAETFTNGNDEADDTFHDQSINVHKDDKPVKGTLYEREISRLLDSLGPRFIDWWWNTPLPVDVDVLQRLPLASGLHLGNALLV